MNIWCRSRNSYYFFVVVGVFSIIMNWKITMCINIMFFATYIFLKSPKHLKIRDDENLCKWEAFKRFLEDYSMLDTQEENAIVIWEKYLIYAISLGLIIVELIQLFFTHIGTFDLIDIIYIIIGVPVTIFIEKIFTKYDNINR